MFRFHVSRNFSATRALINISVIKILLYALWHVLSILISGWKICSYNRATFYVSLLTPVFSSFTVDRFEILRDCCTLFLLSPSFVHFYKRSVAHEIIWSKAIFPIEQRFSVPFVVRRTRATNSRRGLTSENRKGEISDPSDETRDERKGKETVIAKTPAVSNFARDLFELRTRSTNCNFAPRKSFSLYLYLVLRNS